MRLIIKYPANIDSVETLKRGVRLSLFYREISRKPLEILGFVAAMVAQFSQKSMRKIIA